ncbi:MAG: MarR family transcriptional regulator [Anaerolineae bacterium]|nr:MarR family transcriptional regulator [Anaerolineae bacterium]
MRVRLAGQINRELALLTGLSEADYEILAVLAESPDETMRALALRCGLEWEKSRLSHQIRRMEARGLVRREECREDNRATIIRITESGRKLAAGARLAYEQAIQRHVIGVLTPGELEMLHHIAERISTTLEPSHTP